MSKVFNEENARTRTWEESDLSWIDQLYSEDSDESTNYVEGIEEFEGALPNTASVNAELKDSLYLVQDNLNAAFTVLDTQYRNVCEELYPQDVVLEFLGSCSFALTMLQQIHKEDMSEEKIAQYLYALSYADNYLFEDSNMFLSPVIKEFAYTGNLLQKLKEIIPRVLDQSIPEIQEAIQLLEKVSTDLTELLPQLPLGYQNLFKLSLESVNKIISVAGSF